MTDHRDDPDPTVEEPAPGASHPIPERIGGYAVRRVVASGGMGTVFEALQENPRRTVAVKVMRAGLFSPSALRRFQYEAQLLARLRHPGIAQVYEAGYHHSHGEEIPFFAMEYIPNAKAITEYADERDLSTRQRIALFLQLCDAVHHGHQKGIVHRDLKPTNILVDSSGHLKVIDFGIARAADSDMAATEAQTQAGQLVGSLRYMSPEQFAADPNDIDIRSDVYALGVLLYELLSGRPPYELDGKSIVDIASVVREQLPNPIGRVRRELGGDLEIIVGRALMKDREQRYQSAFGLRQDLDRYQNGEAIAARPPTLRYQLSVLARRNKACIAAGTVALVTVIAGGSLSTYLYVRAEYERRQAEAESERARRAFDFIGDVLRETRPDGYGDVPTVADVLEALEAGLDEEFAEEPEIAAEIHKTLGWASLPLEKYSEFEAHCTAALSLRRQSAAPDQEQVLDALVDLATAQSIVGKYDAVVHTREQIHDLCTEWFGREHEETLWARLSYAYSMGATDQIETGLAMIRRLREEFLQRYGENYDGAVYAPAYLSRLLVLLDRADEALISGEEAYELASEHFQGNEELMRDARAALAAARIATHHVEQAKALYAQRSPAQDDILFSYQGVPLNDAGPVQALVMWEAWCPYSQRVVPLLQPLSSRFGEAGLSVVGLTRVTRASSDDRVRSFIADHGISFAMHRDSGKLWDYYETEGTPFLILLVDDQVAWKGTLDSNEFVDRLVREIMFERGATGR